MADRFLPTPSTWLLAARPKTLPAAASPVLVGWALAWSAGEFHALSAMLALVGALLIQIGTNFHNDYADFEKGADTGRRSGPLRVTAAGLATPAEMRRATAIVFIAAVLSGVYLMLRGGLPIVIVGFSSILFGLLYTAGRRSLAYLGIADIFVLLFFGPVAVGGTYWVQALELPREAILAGLGPGLLSMAILLVNNLRDKEGDAAAGKRTIVVRFGRNVGRALYALCFLGAAAVAIGLATGEESHLPAAMAAIVVVPGFVLFRTVAASTDAAKLNPVLGRTAMLGFVWSLLFSLGWIL